MEVQAALGADIALAFDECTPFHADRDYTARSTERTHRWLDRCVAWHEEHGPARQALFGIVQGGTHEDLRRESAEAIAAADVDGIAIGGTLGRDKEEMAAVLAMTAPLLPESRRPSTCSGSARSTTCSAASPSASTSSTAPSPPASPATASPWRRAPTPAGASTSARPAGSATATPSSTAAPAPPAPATTRDYISYLSRAEELTAVRLIVLHNLTYMRELTDPRATAIEAGTLRAPTAPRSSPARPPGTA